MHRTLAPHTALGIIGLASCILLGLVYLHGLEVQRIEREAAARIEQAYLSSDAHFDTLRWTRINTPIPWEARDSAEGYVWQGKLFMFGGLNGNGALLNGQPDYDKAKYFNDIWVTEDGEHWVRAVEHSELPPLRSVSIVPFGNKLYLYAGWGPSIGFNKDIWESSDGVRWSKTGSQIPFPVREGQRIIPSRNKLYVFGGVNYFYPKVFNDVWESEDALHWKQLTPAAPWAGRWDHDAADFNARFWVVGGMTLGSAGFDDIWSSANGSVWERAASSTPLGTRQGQVIVQYKNMLWLVGGLDAKSNSGVGDTWYSRNGKDWRKVPVDGGWLGREDHQVLVFKDRLWLFTGMDTNWHWTNDVWVSNFSTSSIATPSPAQEQVANDPTPVLSAESALALYVRKGGTQVLFSKNIDKPQLIASVTKLMTAAVLAEMPPASTSISISSSNLSPKGSSGALLPGSLWSEEALLRLMLIESNNDAAYALAESRGVASVVSEMNSLARRLGMNNTHFANPVGYDEGVGRSNTSTAQDLVTLLQYLYANHPEILNITRESQFAASGEGGEYQHTATNTNVLLSETTFPFSIVGGKTGETPYALQNLALLVQSPQSSDYLVLVVLHSKNNFEDMRTLAAFVKNSFSW